MLRTIRIPQAMWCDGECDAVTFCYSHINVDVAPFSRGQNPRLMETNLACCIQKYSGPLPVHFPAGPGPVTQVLCSVPNKCITNLMCRCVANIRISPVYYVHGFVFSFIIRLNIVWFNSLPRVTRSSDDSMGGAGYPRARLL